MPRRSFLLDFGGGFYKINVKKNKNKEDTTKKYHTIAHVTMLELIFWTLMAIVTNGILSGKIGNTMYVNHSGIQLARKVITENNSRTYAQVLQRSKFINTIRAYQRAKKEFFDKAFQYKPKGQSFYNMFVKTNVKNSVNVSKACSKDAGYPNLGFWQITAGSLNCVQPIAKNTHPHSWEISFPEYTFTSATLGEFSEQLIKNYNVEKDDICTLLVVKDVNYTIDELPLLEPTKEIGVSSRWYIEQFIINESSRQPFSALFSKEAQVSISIDNGNLRLNHNQTGEYTDYFGIVISRVKRGKVLVSNSKLVPSYETAELINECMSKEWVNQVVQTWEPTEAVILEGSISE